MARLRCSSRVEMTMGMASTEQLFSCASPRFICSMRKSSSMLCVSFRFTTLPQEGQMPVRAGSISPQAGHLCTLGALACCSWRSSWMRASSSTSMVSSSMPSWMAIRLITWRSLSLMMPSTSDALIISSNRSENIISIFILFVCAKLRRKGKKTKEKRENFSSVCHFS